MLIIGLGNPDRGDDSAGILVARRLRERGIHSVAHHGGTLDLIEIWSAAEDVVIVDAILSGAAAGAVRVWDTRPNKLPNFVFRSSTHEFGLAYAIELARSLNRLPKVLRIYGIEARQFVPGSPPSPEVLAGISEAVERLTMVSLLPSARIAL